MRRPGITLVELLVVIAIIGIIITLLLPAVQASREAARRTRCNSNMRQLLMAMHDYENVHGVLPTAGPGGRHGWLVLILPFVEQKGWYDTIDLNAELAILDTPAHHAKIQLYRCPSDGSERDDWQQPANYSGNFGLWYNSPKGFRGVFQPYVKGIMGGGPIKLADIVDGTAHTAAVSEILVGDGSLHRRRVLLSTATLNINMDQFAAMCAGGAYNTDSNGDPIADKHDRGRPWLIGGPGRTWYNHVLPPNRPSCGNGGVAPAGGFTAASNHPSGVVVAFADGHLAFQPDTTDVTLWRQIGIRDDGAPFH